MDLKREIDELKALVDKQSETLRKIHNAIVGDKESKKLEIRPSYDVGKTAKYDWKEKSAQICDSIRKHGLDPKDFGCMDPSKQVSPDYSWRGNARMVCTRLLTTPDPGLPETCGCPPLEWPGWRS